MDLSQKLPACLCSFFLIPTDGFVCWQESRYDSGPWIVAECRSEEINWDTTILETFMFPSPRGSRVVIEKEEVVLFFFGNPSVQSESGSTWNAVSIRDIDGPSGFLKVPALSSCFVATSNAGLASLTWRQARNILKRTGTHYFSSGAAFNARRGNQKKTHPIPPHRQKKIHELSQTKESIQR